MWMEKKIMKSVKINIDIHVRVRVRVCICMCVCDYMRVCGHNQNLLIKHMV